MKDVCLRAFYDTHAGYPRPGYRASLFLERADVTLRNEAPRNSNLAFARSGGVMMSALYSAALDLHNQYGKNMDDEPGEKRTRVYPCTRIWLALWLQTYADETREQTMFFFRFLRKAMMSTNAQLSPGDLDGDMVLLLSWFGCAAATCEPPEKLTVATWMEHRRALRQINQKKASFAAAQVEQSTNDAEAIVALVDHQRGLNQALLWNSIYGAIDTIWLDQEIKLATVVRGVCAAYDAFLDASTLLPKFPGMQPISDAPLNLWLKKQLPFRPNPFTQPQGVFNATKLG